MGEEQRAQLPRYSFEMDALEFGFVRGLLELRSGEPMVEALKVRLDARAEALFYSNLGGNADE